METVTIRDVARRAGVGVGTVSRVINSSPSVSKDTRQRVLDAIEELDYHPSPIARRLSLGKTLSVAVIVPFFTRPVFIDRLRGIEHALAQSEYDLVLYNVESIERRAACFSDFTRPERVDGLIIMSLAPQDEEAERFVNARVPAVLIDAFHPSLNRLLIDDVEGGRLATEHLISLGHQKIGYISDYLENRFGFVSSRDRFQGYYMALEAADIPFKPEYNRQGDHSKQEAQRMARELLTLPDPPTAIFAASDTLAIGVLSAARSMGLAIPQDLSIVGYDDIELAEYLHLTTIRQPSFDLGLEGVRLLMKVIDKPDQEPIEVYLPIELVIRNTTAAACT